MARTTHDMDLDHHGVLPDDFLASGTPAPGDAPISNGDGTRTWGPAGSGGPGGGGPLAWSPVMADAPHVITTTGEPLYVPLVTADGQAVLAQVYVE